VRTSRGPGGRCGKARMAHSSTRPVKPPDQGWTSPMTTCPTMPAWGSISCTVLGHLLAPANASIRAVGPSIAIGARARHIDGSGLSSPISERQVRCRESIARTQPTCRSALRFGRRRPSFWRVVRRPNGCGRRQPRHRLPSAVLCALRPAQAASVLASAAAPGTSGIPMGTHRQLRSANRSGWETAS
jgi:hypothetical protein